MTKRRSRGDGGLHWDESRQRWVAEITIGYDGRGKRITRKRSAKSKTDAKERLKELIRDYDDGLAIGPQNYTVGDAVTYWLTYGLSGRSAATIANYRGMVEVHVIPALGARKLRELSTEDVDRWLKAKSKTLSTRSLRLIHALLSRAVKYAQARDKVKRNVVALADVPAGCDGRRSKSLTLEQAESVLAASESSRLHAYVVLSLLIGARTEELRALKWEEVDLKGKPKADPPIPPSISVFRSVREGGDTKTRKSRRRLAMPTRCVEALDTHQSRQTDERAKAGKNWKEHGLVFASAVGTALDSHNVRRAFRNIIKSAGMPEMEWSPREMRHSFVSLLSDSGVPLEHISRLVGHSGTAVTEAVYRQQIRPIMDEGATAMNEIFGKASRTDEASDQSPTTKNQDDAA